MKALKLVGVFMIAVLAMNPLVYGQALPHIMVQDATLVPLRTVSEELKADVNFDATSGKIFINYEDNNITLTPGHTLVTVNGQQQSLSVAPQVIKGTTYVPLRFIGEALGAKVDYQQNKVSVQLGDVKKEWILEKKDPNAQAFKKETKNVLGKQVKCITIDIKNTGIIPRIELAGGKINQVADLKTLAGKGQVAINGTYFAAYNGNIPYPDGTLVKNGKPLHITDIGCTIGFTPDGQVLIDFVQTRARGYVNDEPRWVSYRINRATPDTSATVIYTPEYGSNIALKPGSVGVVCSQNKVIKKVTDSAAIPQDGFVVVMASDSASRLNVGDRVRYEVTFEPMHTSKEDWDKVQDALSAGPSLMINGQKTPNPKEEGFSDPKILTQVAARSFIGITPDQKVIVGTTSASINEMKNIVKELGLQSAMCLDGGASSGLYYKGSYLTQPGRQINNSIVFKE